MNTTDTDRPWQAQAVRKIHTYFVAGKRNFLLQSTMGAGKTRAAIRAAREMLAEGRINRVVVVVRSRPLVKQWSKKANELGVPLEKKWNPFDDPLTPSFVGMVITYQKLASSAYADWFETCCANNRVLVIMDEPHHMSEDPDMAWGGSAAKGFADAVFRLLLTATPWRSDGSKIPFVEYDDKGLVKADFTYTYADGIIDRICRKASFPTVNGAAEYMVRGRTITHENLADVTQETFAMVCATLFKPGAGWLGAVLDAAHEDLMLKRRNGHPDAGALLVVNRTEHARAIAATLRKKVGKGEVVVATSDIKEGEDDEDGAAAIERFTKGTMCWLIAVGMVSEGIDIPRLRVGVYATTVRTLLAFLQFVGRFVRKIGGLKDTEELASIYIAKMEPYSEYAAHVEEQVVAASREQEEKTRGPVPPKEPTDFLPLSSTGIMDDVIFSGDSLTQDEINSAKSINDSEGGNVDPAFLARCFRKYEERNKWAGGSAGAGQPGVDPSDEREALRIRCTTMGKNYLIKKFLPRKPKDADYELFFGQTVPKWFGVKIVEASNDQLYEIRQRLGEMLTGGRA